MSDARTPSDDTSPPRLPFWRLILLAPTIIRAASELALARLRHSRMTPARIQLLNERAASLPRAAQQHQQRAIERIGFVIPRVAARLPWRSDCLIQAAAAQRWLANCGVASAISIGVDRGPNGEFLAHAWLKHGETIVTGGEISGYRPLLEPGQSGS